MKTIFLINPVAGRGRGKKYIDIINSNLNGKLRDGYNIFITQKRGDAKDFANKVKNEEIVLACIGGDGTLNEIINGLGAFSNVVLSVLPIGSGNDFSRSINGTSNLDVFFSKINEAIFKFIDIGKINLISKEGTSINHLFLNSCGIGFDALSAYYSNQKSRLKGLPLYLKAVTKSLRSYFPSEISIVIDKKIEIKGEKIMISIGNGKTSGGGFFLTPQAEIDDGKLDIAIAEHVSLIKILSLLPKAINGKYINSIHVKYQKLEDAVFQIQPGNYLHTDGEVISTNADNLEVSILKSALKVLR